MYYVMNCLLYHQLFFNDNGDMRITKSKSTLTKKLQIDVSARLTNQPEAIILDGCAILWVISWPANGTVEDFLKLLLAYIVVKL